jgi:hypothetical protein
LAELANPCKRNGMSTDRAVAAPHPTGEQLSVEYGKERSVIADTFAGRVHVEWEAGERAAMTPLGQLPFFIEYLLLPRLRVWLGLGLRRLAEGLLGGKAKAGHRF